MPTLPIVMSPAGLVPIPPTTIRDSLLTKVASTNPGFTANLPASQIEDNSSTSVASIALCNQAQIDLVNSVTPFGANPFILTQLGNVYGVIFGAATNSSVYANFTGTPGFVIPKGFIVSDGSHQYIVQDGGILDSNGLAQLYCVASASGTWPIPAGTVVQLITSVPTTVSLSVTNSLAGTPSAGAETEDGYRARVLQSGIAPSQGALSYLKAKIQAVSGVQARLVSVRIVGDKYEVLVGGGDPYQVAYAISVGLFDIGDLVGSSLAISAISKANPGIVSTFPMAHGFTTGQSILITGVVGMTQVNNVTGPQYTVVVLSPYTFSLKLSGTPVDTSGFTTYVSGGVIIPNARNISVTINNYPDNYTITFVNPPLQVATIAVTWSTTSLNFTSDAAISQLVTPAVINYINALPVGYAINVLELQSLFISTVAAILPAQYISNIAFTFAINGVAVSPVANMIAGDPEGYFFTDTARVTVVRA